MIFRDYIPLPGLTKQKHKLLLYRLSDSNPDKVWFKIFYFVILILKY